MHNIDPREVAAAQRGAELECQAIAADLERLKALIADAGEQLLASFNAIGALVPQLTCREDERRRIGAAVCEAVTALQFQDMASQLTAHARRRLTVLHGAVGRLCAEDPLLATTRLQPVKQIGMGAGSIDLF